MTKTDIVLETKNEMEEALLATATVMTGIHFKVWSSVVEGINKNIQRCSRTEYDRQHRLEELKSFAACVAHGYGEAMLDLVGEDELDEEVKE